MLDLYQGSGGPTPPEGLPLYTRALWNCEVLSDEIYTGSRIVKSRRMGSLGFALLPWVLHPFGMLPWGVGCDCAALLLMAGKVELSQMSLSPFPVPIISPGSPPPYTVRSWKEVMALLKFLGTELPLQLGKQHNFQADKK